MNTNEVLLLLQDTRRYLSNIPYINSGGCGVSALAIYDLLKKNDIQADIIYGFNCDCSECTKARENLELALANDTYDNKYLVCSHAVVKIDIDDMVLYIDSNSCEQSINYNHLIAIPEPLVVESINTARWNRSFNRSYIPKIKEDLKLEYNINP